MSLFLILAAPLWFLLIVSFYPKPSRAWRGILLPLLGGLLLGFGMITITLGILTRSPFGTDLGILYTWAWYRGPGWALGVSTIALALLYHWKPTSYSRIRELSCWLSGVAFVYLIWYALTPDSGFDDYRVLLSPFVWIGSIGAVAWLLDRGLRIDGWFSYVLMVLAVVVPSLFTFIPVLYTSGSHLVAWILGVVFTIGPTFMSYLDSRGLFS